MTRQLPTNICGVWHPRRCDIGFGATRSMTRVRHLALTARSRNYSAREDERIPADQERIPANPSWADAVLAASLFAVDPGGTAGISLRSMPGPVRDAWLTILREQLPPAAPLRRVPLHITDGRLLGGLDLTATLGAGRLISDPGILVEANGGVVLMAMAERLMSATAARLTAVLDTGEVVLQRDGLALRSPTRFGVVLLDEGMADDERPPCRTLRSPGLSTRFKRCTVARDGGRWSDTGGSRRCQSETHQRARIRCNGRGLLWCRIDVGHRVHSCATACHAGSACCCGTCRSR